MPYLLLDSNNFYHNLTTVRNVANTNTDNIAIVLKDNAYGHGLEEIATLANKYCIKSCFVKNEYEAIKIHHLFQNTTILYPQFNIDIDNNISISISSIDTLKRIPDGSKIELKIDSKMHRNGIMPNELALAFNIITKKKLYLFGVFTHNGFGDEIGSEFYSQFQYFTNIKKEIIKLCNINSIKIPRFHSLASSGTLRGAALNNSLPSELRDTIYRIGIALYGYSCIHENINKYDLKPIASLWAKKISTKTLKKDSTIGYGGCSKLTRNTTISTYDIGYGDGLFRIRNNINLYTKEGFKILPVSSMDCISIESNMDEVCIFDDVSEWANQFSTIPYEILVHLNPYITKKIV